jgi:hypothetical protein
VWLQGCGYAPGTLIPSRAAAPFSPAFLDYLGSSPPVRRADVVRRLGEPAFVRREGRVLIWVAPREITHDPLARIVESHLLVVELDTQDAVIAREVIVNQGCTARGICVRSLRGHGDLRMDGDVAAAWPAVVEDIFAAEHAADPIARTAAGADPGACLAFVYLARPLLSAVRVRFDGWPSARVLLGDADNYVSGAFPGGVLRLHVEWDEIELPASLLPPAKYTTRSEDLDLECPSGGRSYLRVDLVATRVMAKDFALIGSVVPEATAMEAIAGRVRELE